MVLASPSEPLSQLEVLVVDCPHLLEIGWARVLGTTITHAHALLIALLRSVPDEFRRFAEREPVNIASARCNTSDPHDGSRSC